VDELEGVVVMRGRKTHFEQVPVEVVKKIAKQEIEKAKKKVIGIDDVGRPMPSRKTEPYSIKIGFTYLGER
jgi:hypothetical protein